MKDEEVKDKKDDKKQEPIDPFFGIHSLLSDFIRIKTIFGLDGKSS
jgi:hypothetical protein